MGLEALKLSGRHVAQRLQRLLLSLDASRGQGPDQVHHGHRAYVVARPEGGDKDVRHPAEQAVAGTEMDGGESPGGHGEALLLEEVHASEDAVVRLLEQRCVLDLQLGKAPEGVGKLEGLEGPEPADSKVSQGGEHVRIVELELRAGPSDRSHTTGLRVPALPCGQEAREQQFGPPLENGNACVWLPIALDVRTKSCDTMPGRAGIHEAHFLVMQLHELQKRLLAAFRFQNDSTVQLNMCSHGMAVASSRSGPHGGVTGCS
mmetsp:Transcript_42520/g.101703  ORF Transcript_42520/g.101703 Transcript_42520/m.101703 type:complete len:261 (-) Transcript_42520:87-869(-)